MERINEFRDKFKLNLFEFTRHAVDQSIVRYISVQEVKEAVTSEKSTIIEDYPNDKYGPSCIVFGYTKNGRPLHIQCSYPNPNLIKIITLYQPDPDIWIDHRERKK